MKLLRLSGFVLALAGTSVAVASWYERAADEGRSAWLHQARSVASDRALHGLPAELLDEPIAQNTRSAIRELGAPRPAEAALAELLPAVEAPPAPERAVRAAAEGELAAHPAPRALAPSAQSEPRTAPGALGASPSAAILGAGKAWECRAESGADELRAGAPSAVVPAECAAAPGLAEAEAKRGAFPGLAGPRASSGS